MNERTKMPQRRGGMKVRLSYGQFEFLVTMGYYPSGKIGEVFLSRDKAKETEIDSIARDVAILISLCIQHGISLKTLADSVTREHQNRPSSVIGAVLDLLLSAESLISNDHTSPSPVTTND